MAPHIGQSQQQPTSHPPPTNYMNTQHSPTPGTYHPPTDQRPSPPLPATYVNTQHSPTPTAYQPPTDKKPSPTPSSSSTRRSSEKGKDYKYPPGFHPNSIPSPNP
mmetsp:Transcript_14920/g.24750  ORF Transcript_14920/g.24750 Transcript_14920/m.24750 type:complete len:105 (+) Transcript_14920:1587-1901(+)